jgi:hypothetical protein
MFSVIYFASEYVQCSILYNIMFHTTVGWADGGKIGRMIN